MKTILIIAYVSMHGVPSIAIHERPDIAQCRKEATTVYNSVKAGSVRAWCAKVVP